MELEARPSIVPILRKYSKDHGPLNLALLFLTEPKLDDLAPGNKTILVKKQTNKQKNLIAASSQIR